MGLIALAASAYWNHKQPIFQNAAQLIAAMQAFSRDQMLRGRQLPPEVSLQELLQGGYLTANDVRAFEGMDVVFSTRYKDSNPPLILARARTQDGQIICLLADGSVQQFSQARYEQYLSTLTAHSDFAPPATTNATTLKGSASNVTTTPR